MLEIMYVLCMCLEKGIHICAIKGSWQLDNSIQSKVMAMALTIAAEIEPDLISLRTKEALQARKNKRMPKRQGKRKLDKFRPEIEALLNNGSTQK
ncbi:MAG: recombinase family protein [Saprospiraceae bacterium]|nr:recombinase family protein [Saprospiraceae bacterium]